MTKNEKQSRLQVRLRINILFGSMRSMLWVVAALLFALFFTAVEIVHAARPMITDDARVVDDKSCQLEAWSRQVSDGNERWALPACNFGRSIEWTLGGSYVSTSGLSGNTDVIAQAKHVFVPLVDGAWGRGFSIGYASHEETRPRRFLGDAYATLLNSYASADGRRVLHTNLGWTHDRATASDRLTWGVATEFEQSARLYWIAEVFGRDQGRAWFQAGARVWLVPDRVQVDATLGNRFGSGPEDRWVSIGLRLLSPAFLP
jgi:hypothetical protein